MNKLELKILQEHQLEMLKKVDEVCKKNNIEYFLTWGSALGAVRHGGFIPWDDDIDISMTWDNYKKFEKIAQKELGNKYFYQSQETDKYCFTTWNKVRINNTTSMEKHLKHIKCHYGICMDIFPIVGVPSSLVKRLIQKIQVLLYRLFTYERYLTNRNPKGNILFKIIYGVFPRKVKSYIIKRSLKGITKYDIDNCNEWVEFLSGNFDKMTIKREIFGNGSKVMFEDIETIIPEKYDEYLSYCYGEYMILPAEEYRLGHSDAIIDFERSYEYYWED
ncbi:phosphorylcholine transferase LicD [Clostridium sp.]|uniref:LicD family protein n=1 Tax=Clostridium sp. TaxID=1506 RepID=UPI0026109339|nr:LicD family protein [Clostridium sp.]